MSTDIETDPVPKRNLTRAEINRRYRERHPLRIRAYLERPEVRKRRNFSSKIQYLGTLGYYNERIRRKNPETWCHRAVIQLRHKSKKRGIPFDLTGDEIFATVPTDLICPVLGIPLIFGGNKISPNSPSVDRIVPSLGYVHGNIAVISTRANSIKGACTDARALRLVADYVERALATQETLDHGILPTGEPK